MKTTQSWLEEGNTHLENGEYEKAIDCYDQVIALNPNLFGVYYNKGCALSKLRRVEEAIECYDKAIELNPQSVDLYNNKGNALSSMGKFEEAINYYDKAIEIDPSYTNAYINKGNALSQAGKLEEAIAYYNKVIDSAIDINPNQDVIYSNKGAALFNLGKFEEAIKYHDKAIEINPGNTNAYHNKGIVLCELKKFEEAIVAFRRAGTTLLEIISLLPDQYEKIPGVMKMLKSILDNDDFFQYILNKHRRDPSGKLDNSYKIIYLRSLKIICMLFVHNPNERYVAHYTRKCIAEKLLLDENSKFHLSTILTANDPKEGCTLLDFLGLECHHEEIPKNYQAFTGCFTFNHDSLNQYRLYGKENDQEATGVSLVIGTRNFFNQETRISQSIFSTPINPGNTTQKEYETHALYRCIYIDPVTNRVVSVGCKEDYTFFRDNLALKENRKSDQEIEEAIDGYRNTINETLENVRKKLEDLKVFIAKNLKNCKTPLNPETAAELLLNLRYLVKHVAFKEEQECRIVCIEKLFAETKEEKEKIKICIDTEEYRRMYVAYLPFREHVKQVYFAPKTEGFMLFQDMLRYHELNSITCKQCDHPFA